VRAVNNFRDCFAVANACYPTARNHALPKRIKFSLRLFYGYRPIVQNIESFFSETLLRRGIIEYPEFREHIYIQQVRPCFYRNSISAHRAHFLRSHFKFLERTHTAATVENIYNQTLCPIAIQAGSGNLAFEIGYHYSVLKEGLLYLSIAMNGIGLYRISFWFSEHNGLPTLCIGALQGGQDTLEANHAFTKEFWGLRPQNMALNVLRWYAQTAGIKQIYTFPKDSLLSRRISGQTDLDQFWLEQGAMPVEQTPFIQLHLDAPRKDLSDVPTRKRSAYRKRYEFLDNLRNQLASQFESFMRPRPYRN
jgi:uncharacterized protein VirK/YbjX